jgi:hypothetical protein
VWQEVVFVPFSCAASSWSSVQILNLQLGAEHSCDCKNIFYKKFEGQQGIWVMCYQWFNSRLNGFDY